MKTNEELESELEELKKAFYFFSKSGSTNGNNSQGSGDSQGGNGSQQGSSQQEDSSSSSDYDAGWTLIYDMKSDDPALNLGKTKGIHGGDGYVTGLPNLLPYSYLRVRFQTNGALQEYDFYLPKDIMYNGMRIVQHNGAGNIIIMAGMSYDVLNGQGLIYFGSVKQLFFGTNTYPLLTSLNGEEEVRYEKIMAR